MPKSKSVRQGKSRSRKHKGHPPKISRGIEVIKGPDKWPNTKTLRGAMSAAFNDKFLGAIVIFHDDHVAPHQQQGHITKFQR